MCNNDMFKLLTFHRNETIWGRESSTSIEVEIKVVKGSIDYFYISTFRNCTNIALKSGEHIEVKETLEEAEKIYNGIADEQREDKNNKTIEE